MKSLAAIVVMAGLTLIPASASAGQRTNTALGAAAGLVVFGPIGAVAGAAVGYTAGGGIARDLGLNRRHHARRHRHRN
jgi:hypothetical protein